MTIAEQVREACARTAEASESRDGAAARIRDIDLTQFEPKAGEDVQVLLKRLRGAGETYTYLHEAADLIESLSAQLAEQSAESQRLAKEIDVAMHGDDAAKQASLCDLVPLARDLKERANDWREYATIKANAAAKWRWRAEKAEQLYAEEGRKSLVLLEELSGVKSRIAELEEITKMLVARLQEEGCDLTHPPKESPDG